MKKGTIIAASAAGLVLGVFGKMAWDKFDVTGKVKSAVNKIRNRNKQQSAEQQAEE